MWMIDGGGPMASRQITLRGCSKRHERQVGCAVGGIWWNRSSSSPPKKQHAAITAAGRWGTSAAPEIHRTGRSGSAGRSL